MKSSEWSRCDQRHDQRHVVILCGLWWSLVLAPIALGQPFSRDLQVDIIVNQVGYPVRAAKQCVLQHRPAGRFEVVRTTDQQVVLTGELAESKGDFGVFYVGDFSAVNEPGTYYVRAGDSRSYAFRISPRVYDEGVAMILGYFALQRCGPSATGYLTPCHLDDAVRLDNGKHQDTTGGWHDASDLRKWMGATLHGMIGLAQVHELTTDESRRRQIRGELRWGNRYFLNMQEPDGHVMDHVGGDALVHSDGNRWTDNRVGPEGGQPATVAARPGGSSARLTIVGEKDDRVIQTRPLDRLGQYKFVIAQALAARVMEGDDPAYAARCLEAAKRCLAWCMREWPERSTERLGGAMAACLELFRATADENFKRGALMMASRLLELQVTEPVDAKDAVRGFFRRAPNGPEPYRDIWHGCWHLFALCDLVELFPDHPDVTRWRQAIRLYTRDYLAAMSARNSFGIVPYGLQTEADPANRKIGGYSYRYFMRPGDQWWVGINANLASAGVGLVRAARLLDDPQLRALAQRQLDWILGCNPHAASTVVGLGRNHPPPFINSTEFVPPTPLLNGAVMNGLGGTLEDQPFVGNGIYHVSEYWTPMVAYTVWLMALLEETGA